MGRVIHFTDFEVGKNGFSCIVNSSKRDAPDTLTFEFNRSITLLDRDSMACTLATLCGTGYDIVEMDLEVSTECVKRLSEFTGAQWHVKPENLICKLLKQVSKMKCSDKEYVLSFSGGYDSLAAMALLPPEKTALVSIDFGYWFQREEKFFKEFNPYTLKTNFRKLQYDREHYTFMAAAGLLFGRALNAKYHVFGTILEATQVHFRTSPPDIAPKEYLLFGSAGLKEICIVNGLTEVGTAMIVTKFYPDTVGKSLLSLAAPTSEKRFRKQVLTEIVCEKYKRHVLLPDCPEVDPKQRQQFGKNFALDFLALYELKYRGFELVSKTVSDIPEEAVELAERLSLNFYERFNPRFLLNLPEKLPEYILSRLQMCDIFPYTDDDWVEYEEVRKFLGTYHPNILL